MFRFQLFYTSLFILFCAVPVALFSQPVYQFSVSTTKDICLKGSAALEIYGTEQADTILVKWNTGQNDVRQIYELKPGDYSVFVKIRHKKDTVILTKDTTLYFSIEKDLCGVSVDNYFSPNDDNYHDFMGVGNAQYHPNFELTIYNKWGQRVHIQRNTYEPWDGKWNGIPLPDGAYYYVFFYDAAKRSEFIKGDVTILR